MLIVLLLAPLLLGFEATQAQGGGQQPAITSAQAAAAIDRLSNLEFPIRMEAARTLRRAAPAVAVPALQAAVTDHKDGYVRFRALILLSGFNDPRTNEVMARMLAEKNDRLRAVAYAFYEYHPDAAAVPRLIAALPGEDSEFVRPALTRALAAHGNDKNAQQAMTRLVMQGQDFFRGAAIEAIGDYKGAYAFAALTQVAKLDGPLQDDAVLALGKIGDKRALETFAPLQRTAPKGVQPAIAAAICLLGVNCSSHQGFLTESLKFAIAQPGFQELLRGATSGLASLAIAGERRGDADADRARRPDPRPGPRRRRPRAGDHRAEEHSGRAESPRAAAQA